MQRGTSMTTTTTTIKSVKQLATAIYANEPTEESMSRRIYKSTDCGAWLAFVTRPRAVLRFPWPKRWHSWPQPIVRVIEALHLLTFLDRLLFVWRKELGRRVVGVALGSIVEGSDIDIGPYELFFPFTMEQFHNALSEIEANAESEWRYANGSLWDDDEALVYPD